VCRLGDAKTGKTISNLGSNKKKPKRRPGRKNTPKQLREKKKKCKCRKLDREVITKGPKKNSNLIEQRAGGGKEKKALNHLQKLGANKTRRRGGETGSRRGNPRRNRGGGPEAMKVKKTRLKKQKTIQERTSS